MWVYLKIGKEKYRNLNLKKAILYYSKISIIFLHFCGTHHTTGRLTSVYHGRKNLKPRKSSERACVPRR
jgi:hypothetical protein